LSTVETMHNKMANLTNYICYIPTRFINAFVYWNVIVKVQMGNN